MALASIKRVELLAPKEAQAEILARLQKLGLVEIEELAGESADPGIVSQGIGEDARFWEELLGKLQFSLGFLREYQEKPGSLLEQLASSKQEIEATAFQFTAEEQAEVESLYLECKELEAELPALKRREEAASQQLEILAPWLYLETPLEELGESKYLYTMAAELSPKSWERFAKTLEQLEEPYFIEVGESSSRIPFVLVASAKERELAQKLVADSGALIPGFGKGRGTAKERSEMLERELALVQKRQEEITALCQKMAEEQVPELERYVDYADSRLERAKVQGQLLATESTFALGGWILERDAQKLARSLEELQIPLYLNIREATEEETPPVSFENNRFAWPFETVLEMYSPPKAGEVDPTPWVAPFFSLFFGIMLTDAGYGLLLALVAVFLVKKVKMEDAGQKLLLVLFWGGLASGVAGALAGGWFGDLFGLPPLWFNPIDDPLKMMALSFGLGLVHIFSGMGLEFYDNVRSGKVWDGIFDQGFWFLLILGLVFLLLPGFKQAGSIMAKLGAIGLVLTQGRAQKNIFLKLGAGIVSLYNLSGVLGDVLSYSRLLALGLATGVIANVINMVAKMALVLPYGLGYVVMVVVLVGGHAFNLFINAMGSYVHTSRLQYVEFFGRFFEGGGKLFAPFKIKQNYTYFKEDEEEA